MDPTEYESGSAAPGIARISQGINFTFGLIFYKREHLNLLLAY